MISFASLLADKDIVLPTLLPDEQEYELMNAAIAQERLRRQLLTRTGLRRPADVVSWFGAVQAQEYEAAKWALGLRLRDGTVAADIEHAFQDGQILRTHVLRPTWHFVSPTDIRWLLALTAPRIHRILASYNRELELDARTLTRAMGVIERALADRTYLTRTELAARLQSLAGPITGERLARVVMHAELEAVICSGPRRERKSTYALIAERAPNARQLSRDEALATLGQRFWRSHGPATIRDFVWWSGLTVADARRALDMIKAERQDVDGLAYWRVDAEQRGNPRDVPAHLLPIYDEYIVAYRDREAVPHGPPARAAGAAAVIFQYSWVIAGQVAGTWRPVRSTRGLRLDAMLLRRISRVERRALTEAVRRYEAFLSVPVTFVLK